MQATNNVDEFQRKWRKNTSKVINFKKENSTSTKPLQNCNIVNNN